MPARPLAFSSSSSGGSPFSARSFARACLARVSARICASSGGRSGTYTGRGGRGLRVSRVAAGAAAPKLAGTLVGAAAAVSAVLLIFEKTGPAAEPQHFRRRAPLRDLRRRGLIGLAGWRISP